ncbi:hypothetical protein KUCAC02_004791 [Chaenocephalus aceratus]|uniref:Uncharacterized protein n=1 Tax=Chaenocephalus aceratus TaxID=36190 RepID=A0ACB9WZN7_CHAAC|nr:hypothetical protein KUCAC02_004791 [Chaenocephalus aceratus]
MQRGSVIGNVARDLGLKVTELDARRARVVAEGTSQLCELDTASGNLLITQRIDREELCAQAIVCILQYQLLLENPLQAYSLVLDIADINDNSPVFAREYNANILENQPVGTFVMKVKAEDIDDGSNANILYQLSKDTKSEVSSFLTINSDTGELFTSLLFDYEQAVHFQIKVTARDGGDPPLSSTCTVNAFIKDQNDNAPVVLYPVQNTGFIAEDRVPAEAPKGYLVTKVVAVDADSGHNAWLSYRIIKATRPNLFLVGLHTGEIRTVRAFMEEDEPKQTVVVSVTDNGPESLSATATVSIEIKFIENNYYMCRTTDSQRSDIKYKQPMSQSVVSVDDAGTETVEKGARSPGEPRVSTLDKEYNDNLTFYLVLALAVVSFLFITCLVVIISVKIYRWRQSRIMCHSNLPVIPYYPPRYSDTLGTGTLQHVYNYEVCRTTDSRKSDCKFGGAGSQNVLIMDPSSTGTMQRMQSEKSILDEPDSPLEKATDRALFEVGLQNGEIRTIRQVTDKDAVKQRLSVIVEDNGQPSRSAAVIVNVVVADSFPEVLSEFTDFTQDKEYNDNLTFYLVLALAVVSFLFITCLVVIISVKIYRWRQSRIMCHSNLPVIPYYPPRYSDTLGTGTLQHVYNYEVCRTTDSRKSDCKFGGAGSQNVLIMDPSSTGTIAADTE